jgi:type I restriction enzyme S subunit
MLFPTAKFASFLNHRKQFIQIEDTQQYKRARVRLHWQGIILRDELEGAQIKTKDQQIARQGELLVAEIDAKVGGVGIVPGELDGAIVSSHYFLFEIDESKCLRPWLDWFIRSDGLGDQFAARGSTNYAAIRPHHVLNCDIPLPPVSEQRRIVSRVEELAARIQLAASLRHEADSETESLNLSGVNRLFLNLSGGRLIRIDEACEVRGGIQKSSVRTPGANPRRYITVAHVQRNFIDAGDPRFFEVSDEELQRWRLLPGDVLVIEGNGSSEQIGRAALFRGEIADCVHQNHVIRVRPEPGKLLPEYLNVYFNSLMGRDQMLERSRTTSGLYNLSVGRIREIEIPLPSLENQRRTVAGANQFQAKAEALRRLQSETAAELDALMPSILSKAFRGELL